MPIDIAPAAAIHGWMTPEELNWLATQAQQASTIIEIGTFKGRSTRALADHCPGTVHVIDPWVVLPEPGDLATDALQWYGGRTVFQAWIDNLREHLLSGRVRYLPMRAARAIRFLEVLPGPGTVDLVFIDGDHSLGGCLTDLELYRPLVRSGGVLAGHDYTTEIHPDVRIAVDRFFQANGLALELGPGSIWSGRIP